MPWIQDDGGEKGAINAYTEARHRHPLEPLGVGVVWVRRYHLLGFDIHILLLKITLS
jgi:hypothetical protein